MTEAKHTWPAHWIESARNAGLLFGGDETSGQMHVVHGMQYQLEQFARNLTAAERERLCATLRIDMQHSAWDGVLQLDDALRNIDDAARKPS